MMERRPRKLDCSCFLGNPPIAPKGSRLRRWANIRSENHGRRPPDLEKFVTGAEGIRFSNGGGSSFRIGPMRSGVKPWKR